MCRSPAAARFLTPYNVSNENCLRERNALNGNLQSRSQKPVARLPDAYTKFDGAIAGYGLDYAESPWDAVGGFSCELGLLNKLLEIALRDRGDKNTGDFARAFDCWAAVELRRAGFPANSVWPREVMPRVFPHELSLLLERVTIGGSAKRSRELREHLSEWLATHDLSSRVAPTDARVLGGVYTKQADVLIADWAAGVELMISTKSMLGSYGKNMRNRFEESFGDSINLKQRFPMGTFGFLFAIDTGVPQGDFVFLKNMLTKLVDSAGYDVTCLMLVDVEAGILELDSKSHDIPANLRPEHFFLRLIESVLDRTPASRHGDVRARKGLEVDTDDEAGA